MLSFTFCCVEGAYAVGIFHAREAVGIEKNLENHINFTKFLWASRTFNVR